MTDVSVIVPTFGDSVAWVDMRNRAEASVVGQTQDVECVPMHGRTLAEARNTGGAVATGEYLIFLDADDELDSHYVEEMLKVSGHIRRPSTLGIVNDVPDDAPVMIPESDIFKRNYIVIGAMVPRYWFLQVGGFDETLPCLEDWDLFLRMWVGGASIVEVPKAIYRVHVRDGSRNQDVGQHGQAYGEIRRRYAGYRQHGGQG